MPKDFKPQWFIVPVLFALFAGAVAGPSLGVSVLLILLVPTLMNAYMPKQKKKPEHIWFRRKVYGWGWTPSTWQGWSITFGYIALIVLFAMLVDGESSPYEVAFRFALPCLLLTILFMQIASKTGESPAEQV